MELAGLESGRIVLEITTCGDSSMGLDQLLADIVTTLSNRVPMGLENRGAIFFFNMHDELTKVAQHNFSILGSPEGPWDALEPLKYPGTRLPSLIRLPTADGPYNDSLRSYAMPLLDEKRHLGYVLLFPNQNLDPPIPDWEFLELLAMALSDRFRRFLMDEIVKVREWELTDARSDAIHCLGAAAEFRDDETGSHVVRMATYAVAIAKQYGSSAAERELLYVTAPMHDIGKIGIPDSILFKPDRLSDDEMAIMRQHAHIGELILTGSDELNRTARAIAAFHHERWDGSGYPRGLCGEEIPILARICAIADVFDALTTERPYKKAWSIEEATDWIYEQSGRHFDPALVEAFRGALPDILRIRELYRDDLIDPTQVLLLAPRQQAEQRWFAWTDTLCIGIDVIDEHHRHLVDLVNELHDVIAAGRDVRAVAGLLKELELYAVVHFHAEEKMMDHYNYVGATEHKRLHHHFGEKMQSLREELHINPVTAPHEVLLYVTNWLRHHICKEDMKLKALKSAPDPTADKEAAQ